MDCHNREAFIEIKGNRENRETQKLLQIASEIYFKLSQRGRYPKCNEFLKKRGLSSSTASFSRIGFANTDNVLTRYLYSLPNEKREYAIQLALDVGLIQYGKSCHYDTFRDCILFTIYNRFGEIVAFRS